jgi:hypothetical protein
MLSLCFGTGNRKRPPTRRGRPRAHTVAAPQSLWRQGVLASRSAALVALMALLGEPARACTPNQCLRLLAPALRVALVSRCALTGFANAVDGGSARPAACPWAVHLCRFQGTRCLAGCQFFINQPWTTAT